MTVQQSITWLDVYEKVVALEAQLQSLRGLLWELKSEDVTIQSQHPVNLEGLWEGAEITEEDFAAAERTLFPYESKPFQA